MTFWGYIGETWEQNVRAVEALQSPPRPAHEEDMPVFTFWEVLLTCHHCQQGGAMEFK